MFDKIKNKIRLYKHHVKIGENIKLNGACLFSTYAGGEIIIGDDVTINSGKQFNRIGGDVRTIIQTIGEGRIEIGNNVGISNATLISREYIKIEDNVLIGGGVKIYDNDFHSLDFDIRNSAEDQLNVKSKGIIIYEGAFIGAHAIILKGVSIGTHSIVGAGSVVTKDIPENEIWAGNPARYIRKIEIK